MSRTLFISFFMALAICLSGPTGFAQPAPPSPMAPPATTGAVPATPPPVQVTGDRDVALRERVAKLEEGIKIRQDESKRLESELAKVKDLYDGLWPRFWSAIGGILALIWFFFAKLKKAIEEKGHKAVVDAVIDRLFAEDAARFTGLFEAHRKEITRAVMARDRTIALVGDHADKDRIKEMLKSMGYSRFDDEPTKTDLVMLLGTAACQQQSIQLIKQIAQGGAQKWLVLYTGAERLDPAIIARLNEVALAIPANVPTTAASHMATLAMLTQSSS